MRSVSFSPPRKKVWLARALSVLAMATWIGLLATTASAEAVPEDETPKTESTTESEAAEPESSGSESTPAGSKEPVECKVAMVVGCVATVDGVDGPKTVTLSVAGQEATSEGETTVETQAEGEQTPDDMPLQSGVDPWERGGLSTNFGTQSIPLSNYQIGADVTGWLDVPDPLDSFVASQTNWAFTTTTFLVLLATNALQWAFDFPVAEELIGEAGLLAQTYTVDLFGFGLSTSVYGLALSVTMIVAGFKAVTKGLVAAGGEVALAFVAYVILIVLTLTSGFGTIGLSVARMSSDLSGSIASFAAGQEQQQECSLQVTGSVAGATASTDGITPTDSEAAQAAAASSACSFGFALQRSLVELPYQNLQWGQVLDGVSGKERCAEINLELLKEGPWGNNDEPRDRMGSAEQCQENADFNHQATYIRLGIASANTLAAAAVTLLVLVICAMLLWQQFKLLFLTVTMPHALVFAILPGRSRKIAWQWLEHLAGVVIRTVILSLGLVVWLSLFSLIVYEQLTVKGIFLSFFASMAMAVSGFFGLYRLTSMTKRMNPIVGRFGESKSGSDSSTGPPSHDEGSSGGGRAASTALRGAQSTLRSVRSRPNRSASITGGSVPDRPSTPATREKAGV